MYSIDGAHLSINFQGQLAAATLDIKASLDKIIEDTFYLRLHVGSVLYRTANPSYFLKSIEFLNEQTMNIDSKNFHVWESRNGIL
jgi:hypothetical protein